LTFRYRHQLTPKWSKTETPSTDLLKYFFESTQKWLNKWGPGTKIIQTSPCNTYIHSYIHTWVRTYACTYVHLYIRTYVHTYIHTYMHTYKKYIKYSTYIAKYKHSMHTHSIQAYIKTHSMHTHIHTYIHTCSLWMM
jgi:hypothetical protein